MRFVENLQCFTRAGHFIVVCITILISEGSMNKYLAKIWMCVSVCGPTNSNDEHVL